MFRVSQQGARRLGNRIHHISVIAVVVAVQVTLTTSALAEATQTLDAPQTAIPWLSESLRTPPQPRPVQRPRADVAATFDTEIPDTVAVTVAPVAAPDRDSTGLYSAERAGLDRNMWRGGNSDRAIAMLDRLAPSPYPGAQDLLYRLVLSEAAPPERDDDAVLLARIDALLRRGALDRAQALIERTGPETPDLFRRWFDISLLNGSEDRACGALDANIDLSPSLPARIFCLARSGRWMTAAVTLESGRALGDLEAADYDLLSRFLDPELFEGEPFLPRPRQPTPLRIRLHEAIGEPLPTRDLPLAFAWSDLRFVAGWKSQVEAGERLARAGALGGNRLLGLYTERRPAASGGIWERVRVVQAVDLALNAADTGALGPALIEAAQVMSSAGLEPALAQMIAPRLHHDALTGQAAAVATRLMLLADKRTDAIPMQASDLQRLAFSVLSETDGDAVRGDLGSVQAAAIVGAFDGDEPISITAQAESILAALTLLLPGAEADAQDRASALRLLRAVGQDATARRIAAEMLLLDGRNG